MRIETKILLRMLLKVQHNTTVFKTSLSCQTRTTTLSRAETLVTKPTGSPISKWMDQVRWMTPDPRGRSASQLMETKWNEMKWDDRYEACYSM